MEKWLADILPLMDIEHDCILSKQGDISIVLEARLPEIFTQSDDNFEALHQAFIKAIKVLPKNSVFHKQDYFTGDAYSPPFGEPEGSFLSRCSDRFFAERPFLKHECYIILTRKPTGRKPASSTFSNLFTRPLVPEQVIHSTHLEAFEEVAGQFQRILAEAGIRLRRLKGDDLYSNKKRAGLIERYLTLSENTAAPEVCDLELRAFKVGANHCTLYALADAVDLPALCGSRINYDKYSTDRSKFSVGFASPLGLLLNCNHIYNQYIFIDDAARHIKKLEAKRLRLQSLAAYSRENAIARDAIGAFLNECAGEQRLAVRAHFNVLAWSGHQSEMRDIKNQIVAGLAQMEATAKQETAGAAQIYWAGIPGNGAELPTCDTFDTFAEQACCFFNLETNYEDSLSPVGIRLGDRLTGRPVHVDISDEPVKRGVCTNRNKFILGPSGSGKSFFTNHMVRSYYEQGAHVVLVDVGHSYKGLCELVNGYYFTYSEKEPIRFNPFYSSSGSALDTEKRESIKTLLLAIWKKDDETFGRSEYVALSNALQGYFDKLGNSDAVFPCFNSFYEYLQSDFMEALKSQRVKEKDFDIDNFLFVLRPFYRGGEFDYLLNASENLDLLDQRFIVFELDNIKDHAVLFPVVTLIIMEVFISKMRKKKGVRKMILIEEAWKALMKEGFAEYIKYLFKTVRKFYGEAIVVTQEVEDIISSPVVKQAIINNSDCKILLDQSKYQNKFDQIQDLLGLTDKEKALVLSVNKANDPAGVYKEVFISLGGTVSKVYRTEVSLEEYLTYTTEQSEKMKVQAAAEKYGSIQKGIQAVAAEN